MLNRTLIKKFFKGELKPGDSTKDLIVESEYVLVFKGKIPHQKVPRRRVIAWRSSASGQFFCYLKNGYSKKIENLLNEELPTKNITFVMNDDKNLVTAMAILSGLEIYCTSSEGVYSDELIEGQIDLLNYYIDVLKVPTKKIIEKIDRNRSRYSGLWSGNRSLSGLNKELAADFVMRRLSED